jgi:membrane protein DedA with SNARE-associated domain
VLTFRAIDCAALILRLFVMLYFCWQVFKHFKNIQKKDKYSLATFVLLVLSLIMFFTSRVIDFTEQTLKALNDDDS